MDTRQIKGQPTPWTSWTSWRAWQSGAKPAGLAMAMASAALLTACASLEPEGRPTRQTVWAVTADHQLIRFNGGQPQRVLERKPLRGLAANEEVVGIDYRVSRGVLFALTQAGRLYTVQTATGVLTPVSSTSTVLQGQAWGMDFNPAADRIRVVSDTGQNLRLHPETGALVDSDPATAGVQSDPALAYAPGDTHAGKSPQIVAAAYTYNKQNDKLTTNFAIDRATGALVTQGSREGTPAAVSPNTGRLFTVGALGLGPLHEVAFDIADVDNTALAAIRTPEQRRTVLYRIDLGTGNAQKVGTVADGMALRGMAIEP